MCLDVGPLGLLILIVIFLVIESVINNRQLKKIPIRIYVRHQGKSSVTRSIAASLELVALEPLPRLLAQVPVLSCLMELKT